MNMDLFVIRKCNGIKKNTLFNMAEDLDPGNTKKQQHPSDLNERKFISVHIDLNQSGLGGDNSWGTYPHAPVY